MMQLKIYLPELKDKNRDVLNQDINLFLVGIIIRSALCMESNVIVLFQSSDGGKAKFGIAPETTGVLKERRI